MRFLVSGIWKKVIRGQIRLSVVVFNKLFFFWLKLFNRNFRKCLFRCSPYGSRDERWNRTFLVRPFSIRGLWIELKKNTTAVCGKQGSYCPIPCPSQQEVTSGYKRHVRKRGLLHDTSSTGTLVWEWTMNCLKSLWANVVTWHFECPIFL